MSLLILGLCLWAAAHMFKRIMPARRAAMSDNAAKGMVSVALVVAIVLMVVGYRRAEFIPLYTPPMMMVHINNLLMFIAFYLLLLGGVPGVLRTRLRHPMLAGVKTWALAHLLVNGDLASLLLFAGLMAWAVMHMILINRQDASWTPPAKGPVRNDLLWILGALAITVGVGYLHAWLGPWPFGGA